MAEAQPADVFEHEAMLWKPSPDSEATFEQFVEAYDFFVKTYQDASWNPWVTDDLATELESAQTVMHQWTRAEPDFRQWTEEETRAWLEEGRLRHKAEREATEARWERDKARFDADAFAGRRALLEQESILLHLTAELDEFESGRRFPGWSERQRADEVAELRRRLSACETNVAQLREAVGDPEAVVDELGRLPHDRREDNLFWFKFDRERNVRALRTKVPELRAELKTSSDKEDRKRLRAELAREEEELAYLLAIEPLNADEMCSECGTPLTGHGWVSIGRHGAHPCPGWPGWAARVEEAREMLLAAAERAKPSQAADPASKPEPIAVVASGLPLAEVISRLTELQAQYPDAVVKRGRANRWEIWPAGT